MSEELDAPPPPPPAPAAAAAAAAQPPPKKSGGFASFFSKSSGGGGNNTQPAAAPAAEERGPSAWPQMSAATIQGTNPNYEGGWGSDYAPSWSQSQSKYAASSSSSSPPDVEAARTTQVPATAANTYHRGGGGGPVPLDIDEATLAQMQKAHTAVRVLYITACVIMGAAAGLALTPASSTANSGAASTTLGANTGTSNNIGSIFFAIYVLGFCFLMCCFEVGLNMFSTVLAVNFGFLYTLSGRLIFLLFVGFMSFSLSTFGIAAMAYLYLVGAVHIGIMVYFPKYSEYVRQKDYYGKNMVRSVVHLHPLQPLPFSPRAFTLPMRMPRCLCQDSLTTHVPLFRAFLSN
jgi:hypothetical protein